MTHHDSSVPGTDLLNGLPTRNSPQVATTHLSPGQIYSTFPTRRRSAGGLHWLSHFDRNDITVVISIR